MRRASIFTAIAIAALLSACRDEEPTTPRRFDAGVDPAAELDPELVRQGKRIFRFDTFGDETF